MNGYIKLHRKLQKWGWYTDANTFRVFLHLLLIASYEENEFRGHKIMPGQAVIGRKMLAEELKISERQVRVALEHLKTTNEITIKTTNKFSIVTIENWEKYQLQDCEYDQQHDQQNDQQVTNKCPTSDHTQEIKKVRNKENNNRRFKPPSIEEVRAYCRERKNNVNPEAFMDFYQCKDWMVGKNKMKDWRAAVRNWERMEAGQSRQNTSKPPTEPPKYKPFEPEPERNVEPMTEEQRRNREMILRGISQIGGTA